MNNTERPAVPGHGLLPRRCWLGLGMVMLVVLTPLSGCSDTPRCQYKAADSAALLEAFLASAAKGDKTEASRLLNPGWRLANAEFDRLTDRLAGVDLANVRLFPDQLGAMITYKVMDGRQLIGEFDTLPEGDCAGISWGEYTGPSTDVDPGVSQSAVPG